MGAGALRPPRIPTRAPAVAATDNGRRAPERAAGVGLAKRGLWQPEPADFAHPEANRPA